MAPDPTHVIRSVSDFLTVPPDKIGACLRDFAAWLALHHEFRAAFPDGGISVVSDKFQWIDDGKHDIHPEIVIVGDNDG